MHPAHQALEMVQFYEELGPKIFSRALWHRLGSAEGLLRSRYPDLPVETTLMQFFGGTRLKEALTPVFVPSYELERRTPFFFRSSMACVNEAYDYPMHTVARSTSAAPTYFPPEEVKNADRSYILIDGGVFANNPAACAYVEAKVQFPSASDFTVVSLGTGAPKESALMTSKADWGIAQWARPILDTVLDGVSSTVDFQLSKLLPRAEDGTQRYFRIQPVLASENQSMDNVSKENLAGLKTIVSRTIQEKSSEIDAICRRLS